jgi:hypothetical protein
MTPIRYIALAVLLLLLLPAALTAQSFMVMSLKGKVEVKAGGKKKAEWNALRIGDQLSGADVIRTSFASYAKLMMDQTRLVSIDENSSMKLSDFAQKGGLSAEGASGKLLQYAAAQMRKSRDSKEENVFGAVRGDMDMVSAAFPKQHVMTTKPLFRWVDPAEHGKYELLLLDDSFKVIARLQSEHQSLQYLADNAILLDNDREYHWRVRRMTDGLESGVESFRILSRDTIDAIRGELTRLDTELRAMNADEVTLHLIRGIYFEQKGLYTDAFTEYSETVRLAPEVTEYRDMLRSLLFQMKLYNEEEKLLPPQSDGK